LALCQETRNSRLAAMVIMINVLRMSLVLQPLMLLLFLAAEGDQQHHRPWQVRFLHDYPLAVCNDGSPAAYFYRPGLGWSVRRWLVFLEGGGWCWDNSSCHDGWAEMHGSSKKFPRSMADVAAWSSRLSTGIFDIHTSPLADARIAYVRMCSNDAYMGNAGPPEQHLHFRGSQIIQAVFQDLRKHTGLGERQGDFVVYGGCSSGGRGAMVSLDYVATKLVGKADVVGLLDSALWVNMKPLARTASFEMQTQHVLEMANATTFIDEDCNATHSDSPWKCLFGAYRLPLIKTPYLLSQSQYDNFAISMSVHGFYDPKPDLHRAGRKWAERYRHQVLEHLPMPANGSGTAVFSSANYMHCTISHPHAMMFRAGGTSLPELLARWLLAPSREKATGRYLESCKGFNCGGAQSLNWRREALAAARGLGE